MKNGCYLLYLTSVFHEAHFLSSGRSRFLSVKKQSTADNDAIFIGALRINLV
jgi:hypothetical protein